MMIGVNKYDSALFGHDMIKVQNTIGSSGPDGYEGPLRFAKLKSLDFVSCSESQVIDEKEIYEALIENFDPYDFIMIKYKNGIARIYDHLDPFLVPKIYLDLKQLKKLEKKFDIEASCWPSMIIAFRNREAKVLVDLTKCFGTLYNG